MKEIDIRYVLEIESDILDMNDEPHIDKIYFDRENRFLQAAKYYQEKGFKVKQYTEPVEWAISSENTLDNIIELDNLQKETVKHIEMIEVIHNRMLLYANKFNPNQNNSILNYLYWNTNIFYERIEKVIREAHNIRPKDIRRLITPIEVDYKCPMCEKKQTIIVKSKSERDNYRDTNSSGWFNRMCPICKKNYLKMAEEREKSYMNE